MGSRWVLIIAGLLILVSDVWQDWAFLSAPNLPGQSSLLVAAVVRNLLMVAALAMVFKGGRWAPVVLLAAAAIGMARRAAFLAPWLASPLSDQWLAFHSGADVLFRLLLLGIAVDFLRERKE